MIQVGIIMGSDSDLPTMQGAIDTLKNFGVNFEVKIVSAHRTPEYMQNYAKKAKSRGLKLIIAGAGGAAHLPGMVASLTTLPVIGVPIQVGKLKGLDALLSIAQMPKGIPVATMAVDNSVNAGLLAVRILAISNKILHKKIVNFHRSQKQKVQKANRRVSKSSRI
ncbi:MAG: 5-(carboxyamino)imidazole ribonucleotide mutase [Bdellovibrionales bacterium]|nr:5-(carboxyamino)imidazole ribonucleotide mutase [Bdellovibrionales bacterium]